MYDDSNIYIIQTYLKHTENNIPIRVEAVSRFISQRGTKVKAAFVDEKLDELSKEKQK